MNDQQLAAMQMALEALKPFATEIIEMGAAYTTVKSNPEVDAAIAALREALAQPQGEWVDLTDDDLLVSFLQGMCDEAVEAAIEATKEKAAKVCDGFNDGREANMADLCAAAIRRWVDLTDDDLLVSFLQGMCDEAVEAAIEATKEKAAKVCDGFNDGREANMADLCAAAIRSMK